MSEVEESIEVDVPVRTAYNQWTQFETFPLFMDGVRRVEQVDEALTHWVTKIGGVDREFDAEITEQVPDKRIAWVSVGGETEQSGVVTFHPVDPTRTAVTRRPPVGDGWCTTMGALSMCPGCRSCGVPGQSGSAGPHLRTGVLRRLLEPTPFS